MPIGKKILFPHGKTVITPAALEVLQELDIIQLLGWHLTGDWSQMSEADRAANVQALVNGSSIFSSYEVKGQNIWVITDAVGEDGHRASTCILLPDDY